MDKRHEQNQDETTISVNVHETTLISVMLQAALKNMNLDAAAKQTTRDFIYKLQKAGLSISKQHLDSLRP